MKKTLLFIFTVSVIISYGQIPPGYYNNALGLNGIPLKSQLHNIIKGHQVQTYNSLWTHFQKTDIKPDGKVWDMYSDIPGGTPPYQYTFVIHQCGNYSKEGDCYNREHSWPQSWFNDASPMVSDLFHVYPTDGWVNGKRSNFPYGLVQNASWVSKNGSKLGSSGSVGYSGTVFEPIDEYKGDFARTYFYMSVRYYTEDNAWNTNDMVDKSQLKPWALQQLLQWHFNDTVSQKEINRNDSVYKIQGNRNPFIDNPYYASLIWIPGSGIDKYDGIRLIVFPNPATDFIHVVVPNPENYSVFVMDKLGRMICINSENNKNQIIIDVQSLQNGTYYFQLIDKSGKQIISERFIKI